MKIGKEGYITSFVGYSTKGEADDEPSRLEVPLMKVQIIEPEPQAVIEQVAAPSSAPVYKPESLIKKKSLLKGIVKTEVEKIYNKRSSCSSAHLPYFCEVSKRSFNEK